MPHVLPHTTRSPGTILTAAIYNEDHERHVHNVEHVIEDAQDFAEAAEAARDRAQEWAENPEDVEVETDQFSALHHATKASASAATAATSETNAVIAETNSGINADAAADAAATAVTAKDDAEAAASATEAHKDAAETFASAAGSSASSAEASALVAETARDQAVIAAQTAVAVVEKDTYPSALVLQQVEVPPPIQAVLVLGYHEPGDGGDGIYRRADAIDEAEELLANPDFDTAASWIDGGGWTISDGRACRTNIGAVSSLTQINVAVVPGRQHRFTVDQESVISGFVRLEVGGVIVGPGSLSPGVHQGTFIPGPATQVALRGNATYAGCTNRASLELLSELLINSSFDTDSDWNKGGGWTISGGLACRTNIAAVSFLSQTNVQFLPGQRYKFIVEVQAISSGFLRLETTSGVVLSPPISTPGSHSGTFFSPAGASSLAVRASGSFAGCLDHVSITQVPGLLQSADGSWWLLVGVRDEDLPDPIIEDPEDPLNPDV